MTSPAEAYSDRMHEEARLERQKRLDKQYDFLIAMLHGPGFGYKDSGKWLDHQIHEHLTAAMNLIELARRTNK